MFFFGETTGMMTVQIICADIPSLLYAASENSIIFQKLRQTDMLSIEVHVQRRYYRILKKIVKRHGGEIKCLSGGTIQRIMKSIINRPILFFVTTGMILLSLWLPNRILFVEIEGNETVSTSKIIEAANDCGIVFGANRRSVRSEYMKNRLLALLPELQWAGVNTYGCRAVISVKERQTSNAQQVSKNVSSVVAARDGVIESCTATKGTLLCKPGQVVKKGEILISGYTDCGIAIRATDAAGEVYAKTTREITVIFPTNYALKSNDTVEFKNIGLIIGKKRINLLKDSGIFGATCVKMCKEYPLVLPGGLVLPLALSVENTNAAQPDNTLVDAWLDESLVIAFAEEYLRSHMTGGVIVDGTTEIQDSGDALILRGEYLCNEMIGIVQYEGIANINGKIG